MLRIIITSFAEKKKLRNASSSSSSLLFASCYCCLSVALFFLEWKIVWEREREKERRLKAAPEATHIHTEKERLSMLLHFQAGGKMTTILVFLLYVSVLSAYKSSRGKKEGERKKGEFMRWKFDFLLPDPGIFMKMITNIIVYAEDDDTNLETRFLPSLSSFLHPFSLWLFSFYSLFQKYRSLS